MAKKKLSRDQKRKQKLAKRDPGEGMRAQRQTQMNAFRAETEDVIYDTFIQGAFRMFDADARELAKQLVSVAQSGNLAVDESAQTNAQTLLLHNVKQHWAAQQSLAKLPPLAAAQTMQSLVTHIESITMQGDSQAYLRYLQGTLKGALALVEGEPVQAPEPKPNDWSSTEDSLRKLGLAWLRNSNEETWQAFHGEATRVIEGGDGRAASHVCQYLYGLIQQDPVEQALRPVLDAAHRQIERQLSATTGAPAAESLENSETNQLRDAVESQRHPSTLENR